MVLSDLTFCDLMFRFLKILFTPDYTMVEINLAWVKIGVRFRAFFCFSFTHFWRLADLGGSLTICRQTSIYGVYLSRSETNAVYLYCFIFSVLRFWLKINLSKIGLRMISLKINVNLFHLNSSLLHFVLSCNLFCDIVRSEWVIAVYSQTEIVSSNLC